ncbi:pca operon transcription factor PcaQ [Epibacterium sp. Ofav1-8]|uniref:pca operon transcription factor PcaQ n=1 Tax=Epibacterium sp. Ofav1-8 TaxID=2917735 RepID=UPI002101EBFD|nr:pca operon transcription factor PcaQ [Epibacterium sp. Ofav1-8]MCG7622799.1 pca operon transcription factor PcaQ [Epibacterium sp. Ofav1-8]
MGNLKRSRQVKIRHMQCLSEAVAHGSLKGAAEYLGLTQPAMSRTLKELEEILGATLLRRSRAGVELTEAGEIFAHFARMSLAALDHGLDSVDRTQGGLLRQEVTVGALPSVAAGLLPRVAEEFRRLAPEAVLRLSDGPHGMLIDLLRSGAVSMVIGRLGDPAVMQGVSFTQLYTEEVVSAVRPGHPCLAAPSLSDLTRWPVIFPPSTAAIRPLVERWLISHGLSEPPQRIETVSGAFARVHARDTDAIWMISRGVVRNELADGRLVELPFDMSLTKGPVGLMLRQDAERTPLEGVFLKALHAAIGALGYDVS